MYANKLVTTRYAIENKNASRTQVMEPGASNNPPDPDSFQIFYYTALWWRAPPGIQGSFEPMCPLFLN
eukprot:521952-Pelagomonas_calceolata.AAC.1